MECADLVNQLGLVHDPDNFLRHGSNDLLAVECAAAALDGVELRVDLVYAVDCQIYVVQLVDGQQRNAQFTSLRLGSLGGRDCLNLQTVLDHFADCIDHVVCGGTGAQTDYHAVLYISGSLIACKFFHIHCISSSQIVIPCDGCLIRVTIHHLL